MDLWVKAPRYSLWEIKSLWIDTELHCQLNLSCGWTGRHTLAAHRQEGNVTPFSLWTLQFECFFSILIVSQTQYLPCPPEAVTCLSEWHEGNEVKTSNRRRCQHRGDGHCRQKYFTINRHIGWKYHKISDPSQLLLHKTWFWCKSLNVLWPPSVTI